MAADRMATDLAHLTDPWQPAVLQLIAITAEAGAAGRQAGRRLRRGRGRPAAGRACWSAWASRRCRWPRAAVRPVGAQLAHGHACETCEDAAEAALSAADPMAARAAVRALLRVTGASEPRSDAAARRARPAPGGCRRRDRQVELGEDAVGVLGDGLLGDEQAPRRSRRWTGPRPSAPSTSRSRGGQPVERLVALAGHQRRRPPRGRARCRRPPPGARRRRTRATSETRSLSR